MLRVLVRLAATRFSAVSVAGALAFALAGLQAVALASAAAAREFLDGAPCEAAEVAARRQVSEAVAAYAPESLEVAAANDSLVAALLRNGKGPQPSTRELAQRVLQVKEAALGSEAADLAPSLRNLGNVGLSAGDYQPAIPLFQRAL